MRQAWLDAVAEHIRVIGVGHDDLLFAAKVGTPIFRNTFRTRIWLPAVKTSSIDYPSGSTICATHMPPGCWPAAPDVKSVMDRMGHSQVQTTQKYLHTLPDTDQRNLDALIRVQNRE